MLLAKRQKKTSTLTYLFAEDFAYVIWYDIDDIAFESTDPVYAGTTFKREEDSYGEDYDNS